MSKTKNTLINNKVFICKRINTQLNAIADTLAMYSSDKPFNGLVLRNIKSLNEVIKKTLFPLE